MGDGYCNSRVVEYSAAGAWQGEFVLPASAGQALQNPHSLVLEECGRALYVAEREASRVHRFSLATRALEGKASCRPQQCPLDRAALASDEPHAPATCPAGLLGSRGRTLLA